MSHRAKAAGSLGSARRASGLSLDRVVGTPLGRCLLIAVMPSTLIRVFSYDERTSVLSVTFVTGAVYHYFDVPAEVAQNMRAAFAKGEFFNAHIRGKYRFARQAGDD